MLRTLYTCLLCIGLLIAFPWLLYRVATRERYRRGLLERLTLRLPPPCGGKVRIWIHAASAGEMVAAAGLARGFAQQHPEFDLVVSSMTTAGVDVAARLLPDLPRFVAPLDVQALMGRVLRRIDPRMIVLVELELWPNWMAAAARRGIPIAVANGRVGETTGKRLRRSIARRLLGLDQVTFFAVQSDETRARLLAAEVPANRIAVTGNMKIDVSRDDAPQREALRRQFGFDAEDFVILAGSTHPGESAMIARGVASLARDVSSGTSSGKIRLVMAPRHKERLTLAENEMRASGFDPVRLSHWRDHPTDDVPTAWIVDTMGELADLYAAADVAFVGGSLIDGVGGHNVFEPVIAGTPTIMGSHHRNVRADVRYLVDAGAVVVVKDEVELADAIRLVRYDPNKNMARAAADAVERARGASRRTVELLLEHCSAAGSNPHARGASLDR